MQQARAACQPSPAQPLATLPCLMHPPLSRPPPPPPPPSLIVETIPRHRAFSRSDPKYLQLRRDVASYMDEAERVKAGLALQARLERLGPVGGPEHDYTVFLPTKVAGTTPLSAGNLPQIHWDASAGGAAPPPAGAALGVPQPQGFDLLAGLGLGSSGSVAPQLAAPPPQPAFPDIPELSPGIRLPPASQATLAKHALLPTASLGGHAAQAQQQRAAAATQQPRPLYPELAALEPPPPPPQQQQQAVEAALASLDVNGRPQADGLQPPLPGQQQMAAPYPTPSPYGELQLGPQEVGVTSAPYPPQPLPPHAACCAPGAGQVVPPSSSSSGVAEVKKLQRVRDVHVSVALMDEFMRCGPRVGQGPGGHGSGGVPPGPGAVTGLAAAPACTLLRTPGPDPPTHPTPHCRYAVSNTRRGIETCGILAGSLSADDAVFTITTLIVPKQEGTSDTVGGLHRGVHGGWGGVLRTGARGSRVDVGRCGRARCPPVSSPSPCTPHPCAPPPHPLCRWRC